MIHTAERNYVIIIEAQNINTKANRNIRQKKKKN